MNGKEHGAYQTVEILKEDYDAMLAALRGLVAHHSGPGPGAEYEAAALKIQLQRARTAIAKAEDKPCIRIRT
jgi:hypothetical protein